MLNEGRAVLAGTKPRRVESLVSASVHILLVLIVTGVLVKAPTLAPYKLPGTRQGVRLLTYYAPGSPAKAVSDLARKRVEKPKKQEQTATVHSPISPPKAVETQVAPAEAGTGTTAQSGLGEGDISIALSTYFPHPKPDLSTLPHGTKGDVILNAVIDETGKISELTLLHGLGTPIDEQVIAMVKQWTYTPAKKNGAPVASEQELHFHYERG